MKTYAFCLWMLLCLPGLADAQNTLIKPVPIPVLAKKSPTEVEQLLGKPHKRTKLREKVTTWCEEDEIMTFKTATGWLGIHFLEGSAVAFSYNYKMNKLPLDYESALIELGIDVNQQKPGIFPFEPPPPTTPGPLRLADSVAARWQGDYGGVRWERIELRAFTERYASASGKNSRRKFIYFMPWSEDSG